MKQQQIFSQKKQQEFAEELKTTKAAFLFNKTSISQLFTTESEIMKVLLHNHQHGIVSWRFQNPTDAIRNHRKMLLAGRTICLS